MASTCLTRMRLMANLRRLARGQSCLIRTPVCNDDRETVVGCHYRLAGTSGMGIKPNDYAIAWGCARCHTYVDAHHDTETRLMHAEGVLRTLDKLVKLGEI